MKNIYKILIAFIGVLAVSCNADAVDERPVISAQTAPELLTPQTGFSVVLSKETEKDIATTITWNKGTYSRTEAIVNYAIEIAKAGTNFKNPITLSTTTAVSKDVTVEELNSTLVNGGFVEKEVNNIDLRIKSVVGASGLPQYSNAITFKATPYHVPLASSHWLVGSATPGGWSWDGDAETEFPLVIGQTNIYEVTIVLKSGEAFREFLGNNFTSDGNWNTSNNFSYYKDKGYAIDSDLVDAGDGDHNFKYTGPTGPRVFKIDNVAKKITLD